MKDLKKRCDDLEKAVLEMQAATTAQAENQESAEALARLDASTEAFDEVATDDNLLAIVGALKERLAIEMQDPPPELRRVVLGQKIDKKQVAREMALFHGGHVLQSRDGVSETVASRRLGIGPTGWRDHVHDYVERYWSEYSVAADNLVSRLLAGGPTRKCAATMGFDPPQDCDFPFCGCDPLITKAIEVLDECGYLKRPTMESPYRADQGMLGRLWSRIKAALRAAQAGEKS